MAYLPVHDIPMNSPMLSSERKRQSTADSEMATCISPFFCEYAPNQHTARPSKKMKTILLDIGNVLVSFDFDRARNRLISETVGHPDPIRSLRPLKDQFEVGAIDSSTFISEGMDLLHFRGSAQAFRDIWQEVFDPIDLMWKTVRHAGNSYRMLLLSNTNEIHRSFLFERFPIFNEFQGGIYSDDVGALKPDAAIFQAATREFSLVPSETLFVDDLPENVRAAASLGFKAVQYDKREHLNFLRAADRYGFHQLVDSIDWEEPNA